MSKIRGITKNLKCVRYVPLLFSSIIKSQFSYRPLVWMFCSRRSNSLVNNVHEIGLRIVHDDHNSSYSELLKTKN